MEIHPDFQTELWQTELDKVPEIHTIIENREKIINTDLSGFTIKEIEELYYEYFGMMPNTGREFPPDISAGMPIYRARILLPNESTQLIATFSYPSPLLCTKKGRANVEFKPVFYASMNPITSIREINPQVGDVVFLSQWKIDCDRNVIGNQFLHKNIGTKNGWKRAANNMRSNFEQHNAIIGPQKAQELNELGTTLSSFFTHNNTPLSAWLGFYSLYKTSGVDFIVYPSKKYNGETCSMALHPNFVDQFLRLVKVISFKITSLDNENFTVEFLNTGILNKTNINWAKITQEVGDELVENKLCFS